MTLDLSAYSAEAWSDLQTRIEEERDGRFQKCRKAFEVNFHDGIGFLHVTIQSKSIDTLRNLYHRLSAEAKLRAAGGGEFDYGETEFFLWKHNQSRRIATVRAKNMYQGTICFTTPEQALSAYATLTPDEQAAIFGFGEG